MTKCEFIKKCIDRCESKWGTLPPIKKIQLTLSFNELHDFISKWTIENFVVEGDIVFLPPIANIGRDINDY